MSDPGPRPIRALDELRQDLAPSRDLWPGIASAIAATPQAATTDRAATSRDARTGSRARGSAAPRPRRAPWAFGLGLAATLACLAIGVWIGRASLPPAMPAAAFAPDAGFGAERQALMVQASLGLAQLPPEDRARVEASLATIRGAIAEIRAALGDDPGNLLLQEMLVNVYQDEIRVLSAVKDAGAPGQET